MHPIDFCPAAACAAALARLETRAERLERQLEDPLQPLELLRQLEQLLPNLLATADEARTRLAAVDAVSAAGAMAQLLAAIRDNRVCDDAERLRARELEARAVNFLVSAGLYDAGFCRLISQTKPGDRRALSYPASRAISASESS